jgi:hypothetical protein
VRRREFIAPIGSGTMVQIAVRAQRPTGSGQATLAPLGLWAGGLIARGLQSTQVAPAIPRLPAHAAAR